MSEIREGLEDAVEVIKDGAQKVMDGAKNVYEKAKPYIEDGIEMAKDGAQNLYYRVKPAIDNLKDQLDGDAPAAGEYDVHEEISREVDEQVNQIRSAAVTPTPFTEYIRENFGKKKENKEE